MALQDLRRLFSLESLDTRFFVPAGAPPKDALEEASFNEGRPFHIKDGRVQEKELDGMQAPRWNTPEFYFYAVVIGISVPLMFKSVLDVSKESHPNYSKFSHLLSDGWIPGRKVDNSDAQYSGFRQNIPYLILVVLLHPLLRKAYDAFWRADTYTQVARRPTTGLGSQLSHGLTASAAADARLEQRISFDVPFSVVFLAALHGFSAFKIIAILYLNYTIAKKAPRKYVPALTWIFGIGVLFTNELCRGYSYEALFSFFVPASPASEKEGLPVPRNFGHTLDSYGGLIPRWEVLFNFTVLRLISFNLDYYWSFNSRAGSPIEKKQLDPSNLSERDRIALPAAPSDFCFRTYFAYTMYSPLYLAGPILTFNDYVSQLRYRAPSITPHRTFLYAIRFLVCLLTMEIMIHYMYMVSIFKAQPDWGAYTPSQLSMLGYFNLKHIWLKLLLPWRLFRLWALLDGIDPPENMVRCMSNNYSVTQFWRGWHRSFNKWTLRYLYIPLGGSAAPGAAGKLRAVGNYLAVFTFIAIWHDIQLRLLMWGWLVTVFVLPEIIAGMLFPAKEFSDRPTVYRMLCGVGAVAEIIMLMLANMVGFALGVEGLRGLVEGVLGSWRGLAFFWGACGVLFTGVQVMFELRVGERRRGVNVKC